MPDLEIKKGQILADTIYNPLETKWLKTGGERGAKTIGGLDMFIGQGLASADIWFGEKISEKEISQLEKRYRQHEPEQFLIMYDAIRDKSRTSEN